MILVANKIDVGEQMADVDDSRDYKDMSRISSQIKKRTVTKEDGQALADRYQCHYFETSAKTG